jgi:hypothetical protein
MAQMVLDVFGEVGAIGERYFAFSSAGGDYGLFLTKKIIKN